MAARQSGKWRPAPLWRVPYPSHRRGRETCDRGPDDTILNIPGRHLSGAVRWKGLRRYLGHLLGSGPDRRLAPDGDAGTPALVPPTAWCAPEGRQARRAGMCHDACGADVPARESDRSRQDFQDSHPTRRLLWPTDGLAGVRGIPALARTPQGGAPFVNMRVVNERVADRQRWPWRTIMQPGCDVVPEVNRPRRC